MEDVCVCDGDKVGWGGGGGSGRGVSEWSTCNDVRVDRPLTYTP